jgi:2-methylcitrate dehydratase PrpD
MTTSTKTVAAPRDAINELLDYADGFESARLPRDVADVTRMFTLDTLSLMLAGRVAPGCSPTLELLKSWGGNPQASIFGESLKLPVPAAAMLNSLHAHAFDFDDTHERGDMHGYAVVLPAALAVAEEIGNVTGQEFLAAVAIGVDVAYRVGLGIVKYRGWHPTATCGVFGAAVAASRLLKLSRKEQHNAMGIAYSLAAGNFQCILDGSLTKRLQPAFAARAGAESALLAKSGITGAKNVLEGKFGFFPLYEANEYARKPLVEGLGVSFEGLNASMKPYPSCRFCHGAVDMALSLRKELGLDVRDIASVTLSMPAEAYDYVGGAYAPGDSPQVSAQFNSAYNVAVAFVRGKVGLQEFDLTTVTNPAIIALAGKVDTIAVHEEKYCFGPQALVLKLRDGREFKRDVVTMKGHPEMPMSADERLAKARECAIYGGHPAGTADRLANWVNELAGSKDVTRGLDAIWRGATA